MRIAVLSGSPKRSASFTLRCVEYLRRKHPEVGFEILYVSPRIRRLEGRPEAFDHLISVVAEADAVLWATPVYFWLVPAQLKRFVELVFERGATEAFRDKPAAVLTTSIHFFDHTAHDYLRAVCDDLGMRFLGGLSADSSDLLRRRGRAQLRSFATLLLEGVRGELRPMARRFWPLPESDFRYEAGDASTPVPLSGLRMTIVTDDFRPETSLGQMVRRLSAAVTGPVDVVDLASLQIKGGCQGCLECGAAGRCRYLGRDEYIDTFEGRIAPADVVVFAGTVKDRYLSAHWKTFFDRSFFNAHTPRFGGKQMALLVSGPLSAVPQVREIVEAWAEAQEAHLVDVVTDEPADTAIIDGDLDALAARLVRCAEEAYVPPATFLGVGGRKLLRDEIWGRLRFVFPVDHRYYRDHGLYDFPNRKLGLLAINALLEPVHRVPAIRDLLHRQVRKNMTTPFDRLLDSLRSTP